MNRQKLIEALREEEKFYSSCDIPYYRGLFKEAADAIESQPPADQWIPVGERLPKEGNAYEVTMIGSDNKRYTMMLYYSDEYKAWASRCNVIAWRERLEPYKGEQNDR